jgi:hypothetical protein
LARTGIVEHGWARAAGACAVSRRSRKAPTGEIQRVSTRRDIRAGVFARRGNDRPGHQRAHDRFIDEVTVAAHHVRILLRRNRAGQGAEWERLHETGGKHLFRESKLSNRQILSYP